MTKNPFEMPLQPKLDLLLQINDEALKVPGASFVSASMQFVNEHKYFASTEGSHIEQSLLRSYPTFSVTAVDRATGKFYSRNALTAPMGMGYEYVEAYPLLQEARVAAEEAVAMHKAKPVAGRPEDADPPSDQPLAHHPRVGRPPDRARSRARLRGELRRHQLPHDRQARHVRVRLEAREHRRRQDAGARASRPAATTTTA